MNMRVPEISAREATVAGDDWHIVDVREDDEWSAGHVAGAQHIPMGEVPQRLGELPTDTPVLVVCRSGSRSYRVAAFLLANGFDATNLAGGTRDWAASGGAMAAPDGVVPTVL